MWGNVAEAPGKPFSRSGARLANVLYIHYLSKVPAGLHGQPAQACISCHLLAKGARDPADTEANVPKILGMVRIARLSSDVGRRMSSQTR